MAAVETSGRTSATASSRAGTDGAEEIQSLMTKIAATPRSHAFLEPSTTGSAGLTNAGFILKPNFDLTLPIIRLAEMTSYLVLTVFTIVNLALVRIKLRDPAPTADHFSVGLWVPVTGGIASIGC